MKVAPRQLRHMRTRDYHGRTRELTTREGRTLFERVVHETFHMSGADFLHLYDAGAIENPDRPEVLRVLMLRSLADA